MHELDQLNGLTTAHFGRSYYCLEEIDSTNNYLKEHGLQLPHGTAAIAKTQNAGKGRTGKRWAQIKDDGKSLPLSLLLTENIRLEDMTLLPLLTGLGVCRALESLCGCDPKIKWSNDVLLEEKKVCGILCESRILPGRSPYAVIGMGINLTQTRRELDGLDLVYANSLSLVTGKNISRHDAAVQILNHLEAIWTLYKKEGFRSLKKEYFNRCITIGRDVRVIRGETEVACTAVDIADNGSLVCRLPDGAPFIVNAGETSVRGLYGYV